MYNVTYSENAIRQ